MYLISSYTCLGTAWVVTSAEIQKELKRLREKKIGPRICERSMGVIRLVLVNLNPINDTYIGISRMLKNILVVVRI